MGRENLIIEIMLKSRSIFDSELSTLFKIRPKTLIMLLYIMNLEEMGKGCTSAKLCKRFDIKSSQMTKFIKEMQNDGWIILKQDSDARKKNILLTDKGRDCAKSLVNDQKEKATKILETLTNKELELLYGILNKIAASAEVEK